MNVLALFDGIGCGRQALKDAGVSVSKYYASEIDRQAITVSKQNHPDIIHLGDVKTVDPSTLPKIDLLIGGSPCQGFSSLGLVGAFDDPRSALFFEYVRLLNALKPEYFLLENVPMKPAYIDTISGFMGCRPIEINSARFVPQNRRRLYWTNIPIAPLPNDGGTLARVLLPREMCKDITESISRKVPGTRAHRYAHCSKRTPDQIAKCLTAKGQESTAASATNLFIDGKWYRPHPIECERLQGLPDNYTAGLSDSARYRLLGNGWTVPVIAHIFKGLWDLNNL
jgi:site-specific DNA-cytosine methylase